ncbi:T-cell activation Rho GTPase activating protein, putative [Entamoeba dispar SAW760]|uniref:T-cell activation Rho GTPase activating protein, putative n=1 Tax=Entamoeba dispar (strain ATCC PRA-260 / SAW760) TaxID=370354 RepID=B0ERV6_ENTDS|nr:T-cell activation Rho GTPase activating protein, putative [Entamoeba dispar SAW760]EDR22751.1 T-cell activation Rho GTPase activating protein, putative [Entamoeba dispar SAW760]|eukprot:EDR22751.1 T-cell activation Rho GTPase activating protein, putative [Entamoeba dispar SAW760]
MKKRGHDKSIQAIETKRQQIPKVVSFWEKQRSFANIFNQKISELCDLMKSHADFLETATIQQITGFDKSCYSETLLESFVFITNSFEAAGQEITTTFGKTDEIILYLKQIKKLFEKNKNPETLVSTYYKMTERLKWESPLLFTNIFHAFQTLFSIGDLFFSCNDTLTMITEQAQKAKQSYIIKNVEPKPNVLYCGRSLKEILDSEGRYYYQLPRIIENILVYLYNKGCTTHGIFRETTNASTKGVEEIYHRMGVTDFEDLPPDVVANVFKKFLREMKEKVFPYEVSMYLLKEWQKGRAKTRTTSAEKRKIILEAIRKMPLENVTLLRSILKLCSKIDSMSDINAMTNKNLAVCLAPTLMTISEDVNSKTLDLKSGGDVVGCIEIITFIFIDYPHIYPNDVDVNVTRRSRRMSQRLVTCLAEGMNEEEEIYKGIEQIRNKGEGVQQTDNKKEVITHPVMPKPLLDDIRSSTGQINQLKDINEIQPSAQLTPSQKETQRDCQKVIISKTQTQEESIPKPIGKKSNINDVHVQCCDDTNTNKSSIPIQLTDNFVEQSNGSSTLGNQPKTIKPCKEVHKLPNKKLPVPPQKCVDTQPIEYNEVIPPLSTTLSSQRLEDGTLQPPPVPPRRSPKPKPCSYAPPADFA